MSMEYLKLKKSDLHVHFWGCFYPEDLFKMAKDYYKEIDWNRFDFLERYEQIYGAQINPIEIFEEAEITGSLDKIKEIAIFKDEDGGDFERFSIKTFLAVAITGYFIDNGIHDVMLAPILERHKKEGLEYVEYRYSFGDTIFEDWHTRFAEYFKNFSTDYFTAKCVVRLYDDDGVYYKKLRDLFRKKPGLVDTIVGVDFSGREVAPKKRKEFFAMLHEDNKQYPSEALDVVVHVGENFFDKSIESAIRWCHEYAELGAKRLGHCIALGLDPNVAIKRCPNAHTEETVSERLDQISYNLKYECELKDYGISIDRHRLLIEQSELISKNPNQKVYREYDENRLKEIERRQDFVLDKLKENGTVIETCPTSNLRIGGIPSLQFHPFKKFYDSGVNLVICSDDPGVFDSSLSSEVDLILVEFDIDQDEFIERMGDPYDFRLGKSRQMVHDSVRGDSGV